eukprot:CAMPEP_0116151244 /NCGR_PEP_ID=MMETSP0329-20121206/19988_1 /TAXON_ID=697910 /ORGANISM="Pseudo-nitzschia arenysensis, Strain B593" /LENGTH=383 /DNA_ID=CAMNT_0003647833 /DNA_START=9 /DNA_END=1158 /DNA_ORIENTATION=+
MATPDSTIESSRAPRLGSLKRIIPMVLLAAYVSLSVIYSSLNIIQKFGPSMMETEEGREMLKSNASYRYDVPEEAESIHDDAPISRDCLNMGFENEMDRLLAKYKQVYITMPAKAAGTTLKEFSKRCMDSPKHPKFFDNIVNFEEEMTEAFTHQLEIPTLMASHMYFPEKISKLMEYATKNSLVIYIHREETNRLLSSIREVVVGRFCFSPKEEESVNLQSNKRPGVMVVGDNCQVREEVLLQIIENKSNEIGIGGPRLWTCDTFESVKENRPNLVFVHYKQASKLQKLLAKHHCPSVTKDVRENVGGEKHKVSIILKNSGDAVDLDEWLQKKKELLEYVLNTKQGVQLDLTGAMSCQGTMRNVEDTLFACPGEALQVSGQTY